MPSAIQLLIIGNVLGFLLEQTAGPAAINALALWINPAAPLAGLLTAPWQLVTYSLLHANVTHLLLNLFGLWIAELAQKPTEPALTAAFRQAVRPAPFEAPRRLGIGQAPGVRSKGGEDLGHVDGVPVLWMNFGGRGGHGSGLSRIVSGTIAGSAGPGQPEGQGTA